MEIPVMHYYYFILFRTTRHYFTLIHIDEHDEYCMMEDVISKTKEKRLWLKRHSSNLQILNYQNTCILSVKFLDF